MGISKNNTILSFSSYNSYSSTTYCQKVDQNQNYKTELCRFYSRGKCNFGNDCIYAHGENELRKYKAQDLKSLGVTKNVESFRLYPCFTWVSTGSW